MTSVFLHPLMLAAVATILLPPIIEWLFRRRRRQVELPTIRFLLDDQEQKKVRRQDRILLLLRMAAILFLVLALARPLLQHSWTGGSRQRQVVLLLDGTASMHQQVDVTTAFGLAQKKAAAVIRSLPAGTGVTVVYLGDRVEPVVEGETDLHTAAARVEALRASSGAAPITAGLAWIKDHAQARQLDAIELYVFSDFQKHTWSRPATGAETARVWTELAGTSETYFIDVGGQPEFNYLVTLLQPAEFVLSAGLPVRFQAEVQCRGQAPAGAHAAVHFLVDGVKKDVREISPTAQTVPLEFEYRFPSAGEYLVEVLVEGDNHRIDNRRLYLCRVPQDVRVLILDETAESPTPESIYLSRAIRPPSHPGLEKVSHFDVKVTSPLKIAFENLTAYAVVVLTGTGRLNEAMVSQLERYVADGGALWLFLGDAVNLYDYNKFFFKDGKGLLPGQLIDRINLKPTGAEPNASVFPRYGETNHPALVQFARVAGSSDAAFARCVSLTTHPTAVVVLLLSDGRPAIVEKPFGRGKVILANMTAGPGWTYLPVLPEYPVLVQELLRYLVGNPDGPVNLAVGERFEQPVFVSAQHLLLRCPDGAKHRLRPERRAGQENAYQVAFTDTTQHGLYQIEAIEEVLPRRRFVVNAGADESELIRISRDELHELLGSSGWTWIGPDTSIEELAARLHTVTELYPWLIGVLTVVLVGESYLAWRFGRRREEVPA